MRCHGVYRNRRGKQILGFWVFAATVSDEEIRRLLALEGYTPRGFTQELVSAYHGQRRVHPMQIRRRGSRALVTQEAEEIR